jgi:predicted ester cyclase
MIGAAFNPHFTVEHLIAEGDKAAVMWSNQGAHVGEWFGFAPTGKSITTRGVDIHLLRDGRLAEPWDVVDLIETRRRYPAIPVTSLVEVVKRDYADARGAAQRA